MILHKRFFGRFLLFTFVPVFTGVLFLSCQSPITTPPEVQHTVTVVVQDRALLPIPQVPVEVHQGLSPETTSPLQQKVTDLQGRSAFLLMIPSNGGRYSFVVGDQRTGKVIRITNLLCRDTTLFITLTGRNIPCGGVLDDSLRFVDACARSAVPNVDLEFPDSLEYRYTSTCDEASTVTFNNIDDPSMILRVVVFDNDGIQVNGTTFQLPARGSFSVRVVYIPQAETTFSTLMTFTLTGASVTSRLNLHVSGNAIECDDCGCTNNVITLDLGSVTAGSDSSISLQTVVNRNRTICTRQEVLTSDFRAGGPFTRESNAIEQVAPNRGQPLNIRFRPTQEGFFVDSLVFQSTYPSTGSTCRFTVIVRGEAVQARCCVDTLRSRNLVLDRSAVPPTYRIVLRADLFNPASGTICYYNCGTGGWLNISRPAVQTADGFTIPEESYSLPARIRGGGNACFTVDFSATEQLVWPNGRGNGAALTQFSRTFSVIGCNPAQIEVVATVDTLPALFSKCIFRWDQNGKHGYHFTPVENKGSDLIDRNAFDPALPMLTDIAYLSGPGPTLTGQVRIRSGWKLVRTGVNDQADFLYEQVRTWTEFPTLKTGTFQAGEFTSLSLYSVYVIRVERNGQFLYALVRVRQINDDGQKQKMCIDILFPL